MFKLWDLFPSSWLVHQSFVECGESSLRFS